MSRSGYSDDIEDAEQASLNNLYRGNVMRLTRGARGQAFYSDLLKALDAVTDKRLIRGKLEHEGNFCALGVYGATKKLDMSMMDVEDFSEVPGLLGVHSMLVREVSYENDREDLYTHDRIHRQETKEHRWQRMRDWVAEQILPDANPDQGKNK